MQQNQENQNNQEINLDSIYEGKTPSGQITFLNCYGDLTIEWDEKDSLAIEGKIVELLASGHQFFIVKRNMFGMKKEVSMTSLKQLKENKVIIKDPELEKLLGDINGKITKQNSDTYDVVKGSKDPKEIAKNQSVCSKSSTKG